MSLHCPRTLFAVFLLSGVVPGPLLPNASASAPFAAQRQAPGYYRMHVGRFEVTALLDGTHAFPAERLATGAAPGQIAQLLSDQFLPSPFEGMINAFLVNMGDRLVLVDTGAGDLYGKDGGGLAAALAASGYRPEDVDDIYITHLHEDHAGGLVRDGKMVFPNATVHVSRADFAFWTDNAHQPEVGPLLRPFFPAIQSVLRPYSEQERIVPFDAKSLRPGLSAIAAPGHTPGHSFFLLEDGDQAMLFWGDTVHMAAVQFPDPGIAIQYDWHADEAVTARRAILAEASARRWWVAGAHISFPGIGHVKAMPAGGYQWVAANYTLNRD